MSGQILLIETNTIAVCFAVCAVYVTLSERMFGLASINALLGLANLAFLVYNTAAVVA